MVTTTWTKEPATGTPSLWAYDSYPWLMTLPWQYGNDPTTWVKEF